MSHDTVSISLLLCEASSRMDAKTMGELVATLGDAVYGGSRTRTLAMCEAAGEATTKLLFDPEFHEGLGTGYGGKARLKPSHLVCLAFTSGVSFPEAVRRVTALQRAEAVNVSSASVISALHTGLQACPFDLAASAAHLLTALASEMSSFAAAGAFLCAFLDCPDSGLDSDEVPALLTAVFSSPDVRELDGRAEDAAGEMRGWEGEAREALAEAGEGSEAVLDSDEDSEGNLKDFVVDSEEEAEEAEAGGTDEDEDEDLPIAGRHPAASRPLASSHSRKRPRTEEY
jgi:hypothetical protein